MTSLEMPWFPLELAQVIRGFCILVGPFCVVLSLQVARYSSIARHRRYIYYGIACLSASSVYTQAERWEKIPTPRMFIVAIGMAILVKGLWTMRSYNTKDV